MGLGFGGQMDIDSVSKVIIVIVVKQKKTMCSKIPNKLENVFYCV